MTEFRLGDKVVVCSKSFVNQNGLRGTIVSLSNGPSLPLLVEYDEDQNHPYIKQFNVDSNTYDYNDVLPCDHYPPMEDTRSYLEAIT